LSPLTSFFIWIMSTTKELTCMILSISKKKCLLNIKSSLCKILIDNSYPFTRCLTHILCSMYCKRLC
jgi:hypothetical protein